MEPLHFVVFHELRKKLEPITLLGAGKRIFSREALDLREKGLVLGVGLDDFGLHEGLNQSLSY